MSEASSYAAALFESWDAALPSSLRAAASGDPAVIASWFQTAACVRSCDSRGWRALHVAVRSGHLAGVEAVVKGLQARSDVEVQDELDALTFAGLSALYMAFDQRRLDLAVALLEAGARPNQTPSAQENELSLLFQGCVEHISRAGTLPELVLPTLNLLYKADARPDRPEVRPSVTPLVVLVLESRMHQVADHPAALDLAGLVTRLWHDLEVTPFLLRVILESGGVAKALWSHFKSGRNGVRPKDMKWAAAFLCEKLQEGDAQAVSLLLDCGFDPMRWTIGEEEEAREPIDCTATEEEFLREPVECSTYSCHRANVPFYRVDSASVCALSTAMALQQHELVWRMLELQPHAFDVSWQQFVESVRVSRAYLWLLRVAKKKGLGWRPPTIPGAGNRFRQHRRLPALGRFRRFAAAPTVTDWAMLEWTAQNGGRFPLSPALAKAYFSVLLQSRNAGDIRPSPSLLVALSTCPENEAEAWAEVVLERSVADSVAEDRTVADGMFRLTLTRQPLFRAALALGACPSSASRLRRDLKKAADPPAMWAVAVILLSVRSSPLGDMEPTGPLPLEWLALVSVRKALWRNRYRSIHELRMALSWLRVPAKLCDVLLLKNAFLSRFSQKAAKLCDLPVNTTEASS